MTTVSIEQIEGDIHNLLARVKEGETILIEEDGQLFGSLVPVQQVSAPVDPARRIGFLVGRGNVPANWKDLGREEIEREFYGEE